MRNEGGEQIAAAGGSRPIGTSTASGGERLDITAASVDLPAPASGEAEHPTLTRRDQPTGLFDQILVRLDPYNGATNRNVVRGG